MFFNKSKLNDEHHEQLSLTDLETVIDQRDAGYSASSVFTDEEGLLTILASLITELSGSIPVRGSSDPR